MSLTNVTFTSPLTSSPVVQSTQPVILSPLVSPLPLLHLTEMPGARRRHGNRLGRRSLNLAGGWSSQVLVEAKGGARRIAINDDGIVTTTMNPNSIYSALEVLLLCSVASDLRLDFPKCRATRETASTTTWNQSSLSSVLLFFRHSASFLCIDSHARVYSLPKVGDYRSKVSECVFQHEIFASNYDTYYIQKSSPGGRRNNSQHSPGGASSCYGADQTCLAARWYLVVKGSNVTTRRTSKDIPPQSAFFIQLNIESSSPNTGQSHIEDFAFTGQSLPQSTLLPATGSKRGRGPGRRRGKHGRRKGERGGMTKRPPFSINPRRRQRMAAGRKCRTNLLTRCDGT